MSGDPLMIEHCQRNQLPEKGYDDNGKKTPGGKFPHPRYYDIHSNVAILAFNLDCKPTKKALEDALLGHFRTLAKNVIFGIAYGRGAKAIALQAKENKKKGDPEVTVEQAQAVIDAIFEMYPRLRPFFDQARECALGLGWLSHPYGRLRRFPHTNDNTLAGEFERQAMNFPIQGMIASALNRGLAILRREIRRLGLQEDIRLLLAIHDAVIVECRPYLVDYVARKSGLLDWAMCRSVPIFPTTLDGFPTGRGPFYLGLDINVFEHWSEPSPKDRCAELGIPTDFGV
jgi:DNA polymerase I-like protein with 3'-5' exonuclease and polymerase domains